MTLSEDKTRVILSGCPKYKKCCLSKSQECRPYSYDRQEVAELLGISPDLLPDVSENDSAMGWPEGTTIRLAIRHSDLVGIPLL